MNTRERVLKEALNCVNGEREKQYGNPEDNFSRIADLWSVYLTSLFEDENIVIDIDPIDVAKMMILFKIARSNGDKDKIDNYIDILGYGACAAEIFENGKEADDILESDARQKIEKLAFNSLDCEHCKYEPMDSHEYPCSECDPDKNGGTLFESDERKKVEKCMTGHKTVADVLKSCPECNELAVQLAEGCVKCDYKHKCFGTGHCYKEEREKLDSLSDEEFEGLWKVRTNKK